MVIFPRKVASEKLFKITMILKYIGLTNQNYKILGNLDGKPMGF